MPLFAPSDSRFGNRIGCCTMAESETHYTCDDWEIFLGRKPTRKKSKWWHGIPGFYEFNNLRVARLAQQSQIERTAHEATMPWLYTANTIRFNLRQLIRGSGPGHQSSTVGVLFTRCSQHRRLGFIRKGSGRMRSSSTTPGTCSTRRSHAVWSSSLGPAAHANPEMAATAHTPPRPSPSTTVGEKLWSKT